MKRSVSVLLVLLAASVFAQEPQVVVAPPAPSAPREAKLPKPSEKTLANGLRVIVVPKHDMPLVAARLFVKTGAEADPADRAGLASLTATVLTQGTKTRSAEQVARGVEALGATLDSNALWDATTIDLSVMSKNLARAMDFLADSVRNPTLAKSELDRERQQALDVLQVELTEPRALSGYVVSRLLFGDTPYGHGLGGTPQSLEKITRDDLVKFHRTHFRPENAVLVFGGDVTSETAFAMAEKLFGGWARGTSTKKTAATPAKPPAPRVVVIDMPDAGQAAVVVGRQGIRRSDPNYLPAIVANSVLGGGYSSRLNQEIRIKRGLSYGAGSSFGTRRDVGPFLARTETKNESAAEVAGLLIEELNRLGAAHVPEVELTPRKAVLIGNFARGLETTGGIVQEISSYALHGLPLADAERFISGVQGVSAEKVQAFAASNMSGSNLNIVVVGDASKFIEPLRARFKDVEVIPATELDLNSPTLRVRKTKE